MPPRKRAVAKAAATLPHRDGCSDPARIERYSATRPDGSTARITRCIECGGQLTE